MKNKNAYRFLCVSVSAVMLASLLTACSGGTENEPSTAPSVSVPTSITNVEKEFNGMKTNTLKGYSFDGKYYAERELIKGEEGIYDLTIHLAEDDSRVVALHPSNQKFTRFSWDNTQYKIYVYTGDTVVDIFAYNGRNWSRSSI